MYGAIYVLLNTSKFIFIFFACLLGKSTCNNSLLFFIETKINQVFVQSLYGEIISLSILMGWKSISRRYCWWHKTFIPANNHPERYVGIENTIVIYIMSLVGESYQIPLTALYEVLDISCWCVNNIQLNMKRKIRCKALQWATQLLTQFFKGP